VNRMVIFMLAMLAAFSLAAISCQSNSGANAPGDRPGTALARGESGDDPGFAGDASLLIETQTPAAEGQGRFAGTFEFYRYEIVSIHNMENPLNARKMKGDRIVVEPGGDGRLRFSHIDVRMADPDWQTFRHTDNPGWDPGLARWLTSDGFRFSVGDDSMEILDTGGHANGLTGLLSMRLWYEDEDTMVYEESRWRGTLWDEDAVAIEYREITFRLIYRRSVPAPAWELDF